MKLLSKLSFNTRLTLSIIQRNDRTFLQKRKSLILLSDKISNRG